MTSVEPEDILHNLLSTMPPKKAPLSERNSNVPSKAPTNAKDPGDKVKKSDPPKASQDLDKVANKPIKTYGRKRTHAESYEVTRSDAETPLEPTTTTSPLVTMVRDSMDDSDSGSDLDILKWNCNQIRSKINALIRSGEMKVGEFQDAIKVSSKSYGMFMGQSGPEKGAESNTFAYAHRFFAKREKQGIKTPSAKRAKTSATNASSSGSRRTAKKDDANKYDVSDITLPGEEKEAVPIFDTCDDLRTKINAHLRLPGQTQAGLGRCMAETFKVAGRPKQAIRGEQIRQFCSKRGPVAGADRNVYYAGYVYFEKLRVKAGKPKNKKRQEMEKEHPATGARRDDISDARGLIVHKDERPYIDKYGLLKFA